jgi:ATPase subunit of ABC transporter with duplicated ATPase domains
LIALDGVVAGYREPVAGPVTLAIHPGEVVGLSGQNASGKTTIINAIIGTARVFEGRIVRREALRVAVQQQRPARLREMPLLARELLQLTGADRADVPASMIELLGLRLDQLSGGQYQLLHVWACLGSDAELILLDEPTNNMDARAVTALRDALATEGPRDRGILIVSHQRDLLTDICTRIIRLGG